MDHLLQDRQDAAIWNAIEAENFKQALKLVDKRSAKKPTAHLEALKIYIRSRSLQLTEKSAVLTSLEELAARKAAVTDPDTLELYDEALENVLGDSRDDWRRIVGELRWQYVKSMPKDEKSSLKCFKTCLSKEDFDHARQIANSMEKTFPNNHKYVFWSIAIMYFYSQSRRCPEKERMIWGGLAMGQICKLAAATKQAADGKQLPTRSIHTPQELLLLHRILTTNGKVEQRLEYLKDPVLGPDSAAAKGEWQLWRLKLQLMEELGQWRDLFQETKALLQKARQKDEAGHIKASRYSDWMIWNAFINSARKLPQEGASPEVESELNAHMDPESGIDKSWRRNATLAWLKFEAEIPSGGLSSEEIAAVGRPSSIARYFDKLGDANTAYEDIRPFVESMEAGERFQLLFILRKPEFGDKEISETEQSNLEALMLPSSLHMTTANEITRIVNRYKLVYLITSSIPELERSSSPKRVSGHGYACPLCKKPCGLHCATCLGKLALTTAELYAKAVSNDGNITSTLLPTDRHPADDLCMLSAMCLIKLAKSNELHHKTDPFAGDHATLLLKAVVLLEAALTRSKSNFQMLLLLIKLYTSLGCGSLAMRSYQRLNIKQIQQDTLSHVFFDRISSLHPHKFSHNYDESLKPRSPLEYLEDQQKLYRESSEKITNNRWRAFEHGSYNAIFEFQEVSDSLASSMAAITSVTESRRILRLIRPEIPSDLTSCGADILPSAAENFDTPLTDTNDYDSFPNYECSRLPRFTSLFSLQGTGIGSSKHRCHINLMSDALKTILDAASGSDLKESASKQWLKNYIISKKTYEDQGIVFADLTPVETMHAKSFDAMARIIYAIQDKETSEPTMQKEISSSFDILHEQVETLISTLTKSSKLPPAVQSTLHLLYTAYDAATTILKFTSFLSKSKTSTHDPRNTGQAAERLVQMIIEKSSAIKEGLDEAGWIDKLLDLIWSDTNGSADLNATLKGLVDENFMEEWAGNVVESWRDSVQGFAYFRARAP